MEQLDSIPEGGLILEVVHSISIYEITSTVDSPRSELGIVEDVSPEEVNRDLL